MRIRSFELRRVVLVAVIVAAITALHYGTSPGELYLHVVYRELYFVPILLAALYFGKWGGIATALVTTALYAPHIAMSIRTAESTVGNVLEILFFCLFGGVVGSYVDIRRSYRREIPRTIAPPGSALSRKILVCIDQPAISQHIASFAGEQFGDNPEAAITLLCAPVEPNPDLFGNRKAFAEQASRAVADAEESLRQAAIVLRDRGVQGSRIDSRIVSSGKKRLSDVILQEQQDGEYDAIVLAKRHLTRAQEFLFGNVAVRVVREARCPVLVADEPGTGDDQAVSKSAV